MAAINPDALDPKLARKALIELARKDFPTFMALVFPTLSSLPFVHAWHLRAIAYRLQQLLEGGGRRRLLLSAPPRHFKSYVTSVALPAYLLGQNPGAKVLCASYNEDLSLIFADQSRKIMMSEIYAEIFPGTELVGAQPAAHHLKTTEGGYRFATSVGGTLTGLGADVIIVDDPLKTDLATSMPVRESAHNWLRGSALTRFDDQSQSFAIVTHQRQHVDDMIGRLKSEGGWESFDLPAEAPGVRHFDIGAGMVKLVQAGEVLFPERFNKETLAAIRTDLGDSVYVAQYLQNPAPAGGGLFKMEKIHRFDVASLLKNHAYEKIILSIDPGVSTEPTANFTGVTAWAIHGQRVMLVGAWQRRWDFAKILSFTKSQAKAVGAIIIEHSHPGILLSQMLHTEGVTNHFTYKPGKMDKQARAQIAAVAIEKGLVWFPEEAPWLEMVEQQMLAFPRAANDDLVDSMSQLFCVLQNGVPHWLELAAYKSNQPVVTVTLVGGQKRLW